MIVDEFNVLHRIINVLLNVINILQTLSNSLCCLFILDIVILYQVDFHYHNEMKAFKFFIKFCNIEHNVHLKKIYI